MDSSSTAQTARRLLKVAYLQRVNRDGIECLSPRNVAPFIGLERFCDEVNEAIEYLQRRRYIVDTETARNLSGGMSCRITPMGQEWIDV